MRRILPCGAIALLALASSASSVRASSILPTFTPDASGSCSIDVQPFAPFTVYLLADLSIDAAAAGITSAEFRVDGWDANWFTTVFANPNASATDGNPVAGGCRIAFAACQSQCPLLLYTLRGFALAPVAPTHLTVLAHSTPLNPNFACPNVTLCNGPNFTRMCVGGGAACINVGVPCCSEHQVFCSPLGVMPVTWSTVKSLYSSVR